MYCFDKSVPPRSIEINATQLIARGPCLVVEATGAGIGATGLAILYDGDNVNSPRMATVQVPANVTIQRGTSHGMLFEHGIFATIDVATMFLTISYYPGKEETPPV